MYQHKGRHAKADRLVLFLFIFSSFSVFISIDVVISCVIQECYKNASVFEGVVKVDGKIKHHIINVVAKELTDMSTSIAKQELETLR